MSVNFITSCLVGLRRSLASCLLGTLHKRLLPDGPFNAGIV